MREDGEQFSSGAESTTSASPADPHRLAQLEQIAAIARELISPAGMVKRGVDRGLVVVEKADKSDPHYRLCAALERLPCLSLITVDRGGIEGVGLDWRPIETAPRDGRSLLMICNSAYTPTAGIGWWQGDGWAHYSRPEEKWHGGVGLWFPTHWMPLPAPPLPTGGAS